MTEKRPGFDEYFMEFARVAAKRSSCLRRKVGAVLVRDKHVLSTGYNGAPSGLDNCLEIGSCLRNELNVPSGERHELCRAVHAEQNAVIQCALHGVSTKGATLYTTASPCITCAKIVVNAGVKRVVYCDEYPNKEAFKIMRDAGLQVEKFGGEND